MDKNIFEEKRQKLVKELQTMQEGAKRCVEQRVQYFVIPAGQAQTLAEDARFVLTGTQAIFTPKTEREKALMILNELTDEQFDELVFDVQRAENEIVNNVHVLINDASFCDVFHEKMETARKERAKMLLNFYRVLMGEIPFKSESKGGNEE